MFKESEHPRVSSGSTAGQFTDAGDAIKMAASDEKNIPDEKDNVELKKIEDKIRNQDFESVGVVKDGKTVLFKDGSKTKVFISAQEAALIDSGSLTHNHPGGRSFSDLDIATFAKYRLYEIRAVSKNEDYILKHHDRSSGVDVNRILKSYKKHNEAIKLDLSDKIKRNLISAKFANSEHHHLIMKKVAEDFNLIYKRIKHG